MSAWDDAAGPASAVIHATYAAATIDIVPKTGAPITGVSAIEFTNPGDDPFGEGRSVRQRGFEVQKSDVPDRPVNGSIVVHGAQRWRVIEVPEVADAAAWTIMVESE